MIIDLLEFVEKRIAVESERIDESMSHSDEFFRRFLALEPTSELRAYWCAMSLRAQSTANEAASRREQYSRVLQHMKGRMQ